MPGERVGTGLLRSATGVLLIAIAATVVLQIEESPSDFCSTTFHHASWKVIAWVSLCSAATAAVLSAATLAAGVRKKRSGYLWAGLAGVLLSIAVLGFSFFAVGITGFCLG